MNLSACFGLRYYMLAIETLILISFANGAALSQSSTPAPPPQPPSPTDSEFGITASTTTDLPEKTLQDKPSPPPMSFKVWSSFQVAEAQNKVVQISNKITMSRMNNSLTPKELIILNAKLSEAIKDLQFSKDLGFEDYMEVHLSQFHNQPNQLAQIAEKMPVQDRLQLMEIYFSSRIEKKK